MALTITDRAANVKSGSRGASAPVSGFKVVRVQFDNSYPTGGEAVTANDFGFDSIDYVVPIRQAPDGGAQTVGILPTWDNTNSKLKLSVIGATGLVTEAANASDQSTVIVDCLVFGTKN